MYCVSKEVPIKADRLEDSVNEVKRVSGWCCLEYTYSYIVICRVSDKEENCVLC